MNSLDTLIMKSGFLRTSRCKRVLLYCAVAAGTALLLLALLIASLPALISSQTVQTHLRQTLTTSLKRPVDWSRLQLTWSKGLAINGLALGSGPPPLLSGSVEEIVIVPLLTVVAQRRLKLDLQLRVSGVVAELAPGPAKTPKPYREPLTALASVLQKFAELDRPLPLDVAIKAEIVPLRLSYRDPSGKRQLTLSDFSLQVNMPSLATMPIEAALLGKLSVNGHAPEPLQLKAEIKGLVSAQRRIHPAAAVFALDAQLPGTTVTVSGGLQEPHGFSASGRFDLPRLLAALQPLLKPSAMAVSGLINVELKANVGTSRDLLATLELTGSGLALSGGRVKNGRLGPIDLHLRQNIATDHVRQLVSFTDGSLAVPGLLDAGWRAAVTRPDRRDRTLEVEVGPVKLDLQRALATAGPLLPPKLPLQELAGVMTVRSLAVHLDGRSNQGEVVLAGVNVILPRLRLALATGTVTAAGTGLTINRATIPLLAMKPVRLEADLAYAVSTASLTGSRPLAAQRLRGNLRLALHDIDLQSSSPRRFTATAEVTQEIDLGLLQLEKQLTVTDLHQQLQLVATATESGEIEATLRELKVTARSLQATAVGKKLRSFPLVAALTAAGIKLPSTRGVMPTIDRADCDIAAGDFLQLSAMAHSPAAASRTIATTGKARLDLDRLLPLAAPFLPKGVAAKGVASLSWELTAPLKATPLPKGANRLRLARAAAAMIDHGEVALSLDNRSITLPTKKGRLEISTLRTSLPLRLLLPGRGGNIRFDGGVDFSGLAGLVAGSGQLPPQHGSLLVRGELLGWQILRLQEELQLNPLGISQSLEGTIGRLEPLAEVPGALSTAVLLKHLDAALSGRIEAGFPERQPAFPGGLQLSGSGTAAATINLAAGKELRLNADFTGRNLGVKLRNGTTVEGAHADFQIDRTYALGRGETSSWTPLSVTLLHPAPEQRSVAGAAEIAGRVREDLRGQESGSRKFSVQRIKTTAGRLPLELTAVTGEILLSREQLGLSFLQTELLGGTLRASGVIDLRPELPTVAASCSFSNLETAQLLPAEVRKKRSKANEETEMSGEIFFDAPLVAKERELLEGLRLKLNLRKIGADTLERALFSLDPYERNEKLVAQRKQLRLGTLKWLTATTLDGAFSLEGEVEVKGVTIDLPRVERIRLAELSIKKEMARTVAGVAALRRVLELLRADTLIVGPKGDISLIRRTDE